MRRSFIVMALLLSVSCGTGEEATGVTIVASVHPLAWLAERIAPEAAVAELSAGVDDPHDVQLSPSQIAALRDADVVVHVGNVDYQPEVEAALSDRTDGVVAAAEATDLDLRTDPHVWQSPAALAEVAEALGAALQEADPDGSGYAQRAAETAAELRALAAEADRLRDCPRDVVVVSHAGYGHLLGPRGVTQEAASPPGHHAEPSPRRIADLVELVRSSGLPGVVAEPEEGRPAAETIAREAGVDLLDVHPLGTVDDADASIGYPVLWRRNVEAFAAALGCAA